MEVLYHISGYILWFLRWPLTIFFVNVFQGNYRGDSSSSDPQNPLARSLAQGLASKGSLTPGQFDTPMVPMVLPRCS
jgi:hypothetical protein